MKEIKLSWLYEMLLIFCLVAVMAFLPTKLKAEEDEGHDLDISLQNLKFSILTYFDYSVGQSALPGGTEENFNRFAITRGYFTLKKEIAPWLKARMTTDVHQHHDGDYKGDYEVRLKYLYGEIHFPDLGPLTSIKSEIGIGHMPWLDFEQKINPYRCQGKMAVERAGMFNSADAGVGLMGYLGGELANAKQKTGNKSYAGRWGSWHIGGYNGPGYHAVEENQNKVAEGRLTLRPLPGALPGLQLSYLGIYGEGNRSYPDIDGDTVWPEYIVHLGMLSFEHPRFTFTGQYFTTWGNAKGTLAEADGDALETMGYSAFADLNLPVFNDRPSVFARYDYFDSDVDDMMAESTAYQMYIGGLAFRLYKSNMLLFVYETTDYEEDAGGKGGKTPVEDNDLGEEERFQVVFQFKF